MKFYRIYESLIKKIYRLKNNTKNKFLKKAFLSAEYNMNTNKEYIFANEEATYLLKNNEEISKRIFIDGKFDFDLLKNGLKYLGKKKRKYLINIGAHVGTTLIPAIKQKLFTNYIAFEPSLENFRLLTANININKIEKNGVLFNLALSKKISKGYLKKFDSNNSGDYRLVKKDNKSEQVKLNILDNFCNNVTRKNSLICIDAQGHEFEIFRGGKKTLKKKIPIIFEFTPLMLVEKNPKILFNLIKHYEYIIDLRENIILKTNLDNFIEIFNKYKKHKSYTDLMII
jgi:FkbM family methyltransferase